MQKDCDVWEDFTPDEARLYEAYEKPETLLPELNSIGWLCFKKPLQNALHPKRHTNLIELIYLNHGQVDRWVEDSSYTFSSGDVLIVAPNELHGAICGVMQPCEHYWIRFNFPASRTMPGLTKHQQAQLIEFYTRPPNRVVRCSTFVKAGFQQLMTIHRTRPLFAEVLARNVLLNILCLIAADSRQNVPELSKSPLSPKIRQLITVIHNHLNAPPAVKELADLAHMSQETLRQLFEKETGVSPNNYINIQRIREAKERLRTGRTVTETAFSLGFSSSQYFSTVFKKWAGISPSDYQLKFHLSPSAPSNESTDGKNND